MIAYSHTRWLIADADLSLTRHLKPDVGCFRAFRPPNPHGSRYAADNRRRPDQTISGI